MGKHIIILKIISRPLYLAKHTVGFVLGLGETGVGCHTGWLSHCQYLIRWMAVPCGDLHVTCA